MVKAEALLNPSWFEQGGRAVTHISGRSDELILEACAKVTKVRFTRSSQGKIDVMLT